MVKKDRLQALAKQFPDAILVPVMELESAGNNAIPAALARALVSVGMKHDVGGIVQTSTAKRKDLKAVERLKTRKVFEGEVIPGRKYIIIDDILTQGGTIHELRTHIVNNGGEVVAVSSLAFSAGSNIIAIQQDTIDEIVTRFGRERTEKLLQEHNVTGTLEALTESEGRAVLRFKSFESFRARISEEGRASLSRESPKGLPGFSGRIAPPLSIASVQAEVSKVTDAWTNGPAVHVVDSVDALPDHIQEQIASKTGQGRVEAAYYQGEAWIVADQMSSVEDVQRVLAHEGVGHHGLRLIMPDHVLDHTLDMAWQNKAVRAEAETIAGQYGLDVQDKSQRREAVEEVLAHWAGEGKKAGVLDRLIAAVRQAVRRVFPSLKMSDAELRTLISRAREAVQTGRGAQFKTLQRESRAMLSLVDKAMAEAALLGQPMTKEQARKELYKNRSFVMKIFEGRDSAELQVNRVAGAMQKTVQRLAGSTKWKYNPLNILSSEKEFKDSSKSRDLDYAMLVYRERMWPCANVSTKKCNACLVSGLSWGQEVGESSVWLSFAR